MSITAQVSHPKLFLSLKVFSAKCRKGTLRAFHSGKVSYVYKFSGPSMTIDTACSSSAVAVYQACRALQTGDCTTAIAGGANVISSPDVNLSLHYRMLSANSL